METIYLSIPSVHRELSDLRAPFLWNPQYQKYTFLEGSVYQVVHNWALDKDQSSIHTLQYTASSFIK